MLYTEAVTDMGYPHINPVLFGFQSCKPSHSYGPAVRSHWLIHYVVSGKGDFRTDKRTYALKAGDAFVIRPYEETYYEADREDPWEYVWIGFTCDGPLPIELPEVINCPGTKRVFDDMKRCADRSGGKSAYLCGKIWELFSLWLDNDPAPARDYVDQAMDYIHAEYMTGISIQDIADRLRLDRTYFSVLFKRKTGLSPSQYLIRYRMQQAAYLLTEKHTSVSVAAYSVGYSDIYTFSKIFKKHFSVSPREYASK